MTQEAHDTARDWPEDFEHENGNYMKNCMDCGNRFFGYKRRLVCKLCKAMLAAAKGAEEA